MAGAAWANGITCRLQEIYRFHVSPNQHVLEIGCANGNLLAALHPSRGVGVDFSEAMIQHAKANHPTLEFIHADAHDLSLYQRNIRCHYPLGPCQ